MIAQFPAAVRDDTASTHDLEAVLAALERDAEALLGSSPVALEVTGRFSRPFSEIAKVRMSSGDRTLSLFAKAARVGPGRPGRPEMRARVVRDFELNTRLYHAMAGHEGLHVVRPVACYADHLGIVTEEAAGQTLLRVLEADARWWPQQSTTERLVKILERTGRWLRTFQEADRAEGRVHAEDVRAYIDNRLERLASHPRATFSEHDRKGVLESFGRHAAVIPAAAFVRAPIHADFALGNILVEQDHVTVLDFAMGSQGARYLDLAHLYMHLDLLTLKPQFRPGLVARLQRALLAGYGAPHAAEESLFQVMLVQHAACHYLGVVERSSGLAERMYNARIGRHHLGCLRRFAERRVERCASGERAQRVSHASGAGIVGPPRASVSGGPAGRRPPEER